MKTPNKSEEENSLEFEASNLAILIEHIRQIETPDVDEETAKHVALGHLHLAYAALNRLWENQK